MNTLPAAVFSLALLVAPQSALAQEQDEVSRRAELLESMKDWQQRMSENFRDSWQELRESFDETDSRISASVDLREQNDSYTLRVSLPRRDVAKSEVTLEGGETLRIVSPAEGSLSRYEQTLTLAEVPADAKPEIQRMPERNLMVIRVPKNPAQDPPEPIPAPEAKGTPPPAAGDRDILSRMERMRREMDEIFNRARQEIKELPEARELFDQSSFGNSVDFEEQDENYQVRVYLPDRGMDQADVSVEGQVLKIEVSDKAEAKADGAEVVKETFYSQQLTLPGPVLVDQMKVERHEGMLIVTLPKMTGE